MHIKLIVAAVVLSLVTVVSGPAFGGEPDTDGFVLNVTKVVEGPGFRGPYGVTVTCGSTEIGFFGIEDGRTISTGDFEFPSGNIAFNDECIVTEVDDGGPTVDGQPSGLGPDTITYTCEATMDTTCVNDRTVAFDVSDAGGEGSITITNTYEPEPPLGVGGGTGRRRPAAGRSRCPARLHRLTNSPCRSRWSRTWPGSSALEDRRGS